MLALGVLGPVAVSRDGVELNLRGTRQRALLAALAVDAGRVVPTDVLVERIWGEQLPAGPDNALQQQVLKLRRIVGDQAVAFEASGYRLAVGPEAVDSERFERLVERARTHLHEAPEQAGALLREAISLWRGPALAGCAYEDWASGEAARLDELRLQAEELWADAALRVGDQAEAIGQLERLVRAEPLRERLWALLMLALYRDGRQAEALATFTTARSRLVEEMGVEPGAELRSLHERILRQDLSLERETVPNLPARATASPADRQVPSALARHATAGRFVGRDSERGVLDAAWARAAGGELTSVFVAGEPGVGKTRLVAEHARVVAHAGGRVVFGRGDEEVAAPYGPLVGALGQLVEVAGPDVLRQHVETHGGELARLVPGLAARVPGLPAARHADPDTERFRLREAVVALVGAAADREASMLVLDDVHWADHATLALLLHLLRGPDAHLLVVATYRDTGLDQRPPLRALLGDLLREPGSERLDLSGLTEQDAIALVGEALGHQPSEAEAELGRTVHRKTRGNALFVTEFLRTLSDIGGLDGAAGALDVPPTVRDLVVQRVERIGGGVGEALLPATVIGPSFGTDMLARVTGSSEERLLDALHRAREAALVTEAHDEPGTFFFSHAVIQLALAETLGPSRRGLLHRRVAEELEGLGVTDAGRLGELARHWIECGDTERGREAAVRAGDATLALLAPHEAVGWYRRAMELHEAAAAQDQAQRAELLVRLGEAERRAGSDAFREHLLEAGRLARELGDADLLGQAALANNRGMHSRTGLVDVERLELLEAARDVRSGDLAQQALLLATSSSELWSGDHDRRRALSDEALDLARRAGDERVLAEVIYRRAFAIAEPATLGERLELTAELVTLTDRLGDPLLRLLASVERSRAAIEGCDLAEALHHSERQAELAAACGDAFGRHGAGWAQGWPHALAGRYELAERAAEAALAESMGSEQPDALAFYGAQLCVIRWDQGRLGELADAIVGQAEGPDGLPAHRALAALALAEGGRTDEAGQLLDQAARERFGLPVDGIWLTGMVMWGEASVICERPDHAGVLLERLLPWRDQVAFTGLAVHGAVARVAAELAALLDRDEAGELFALAETVHEGIAAPALLARTRAGWASWLWQRGEAARARDQLERARAAAELCGCPQLLDRAVAVS